MGKSLSQARAGEVCTTDPAVFCNRSVSDYPLEQKPYRLMHWYVIHLKAIVFDKEQGFLTLLLQSLYRAAKAKT